MKQVVASLSTLLGQDRVAVDSTSRLLYSRDMMSGGLLAAKAAVESPLPDLICWPETNQEVSAILRIARRHRVPVIPFGAGSGVSGATVPVRGGIMLDLKRMNRIEKIEKRNGGFYVTAQSGIIGQHLERDLNTQGFTLGHFPSSILCATLGGYLACRSAGQLSSKYGKIEDMVDEVETVLPDGSLIPFGRGLKAFPDIRATDLFVGSEGCLGVITRSRLRIYPLSPVTRYRGVRFPRLTNALNAARKIMQAELRPAVVRIYDPLDTILLSHGYRKKASGGLSKTLKALASKIPVPKIMQDLADGHVRHLLRYPNLLQGIVQHISSEVIMILAFEGDEVTARETEEKGLSICRRERGRDEGERPGLHWRDHRYSVSFKMPKLFEKDCFVDTIEVATTWDKLMGLYDGVRKALSRQALVMAHFSHAYPEGCSIYFTIAVRGRSPSGDIKIYDQLWNDAMETCLGLGATISHHHGIGLLKAKFLPRELGGAMDFYREIKKKIDPYGIMNPGKMGL